MGTEEVLRPENDCVILFGSFCFGRKRPTKTSGLDAIFVSLQGMSTENSFYESQVIY
jgi:hypothetical protein